MENPDAIGYPKAAAAPKVSAFGRRLGFSPSSPLFHLQPINLEDAVILATDEEPRHREQRGGNSLNIGPIGHERAIF